MTLGVIGKKLGMTQVFDENGLAIPVTVIKVDPLTVTQIKTVDTDGYNAIQTAYDVVSEKHLTKAERGHFAKNKLEKMLQHFIYNHTDLIFETDRPIVDVEGVKAFIYLNVYPSNKKPPIICVYKED